MERTEDEEAELMSQEEEEEKGEEMKMSAEEDEAEEVQRDEDGGGGGEEEDGETERKREKPKARCCDKKCIPGILYLGHIPPRLRPKHVRNMLSSYGEIGRVFLQPEDRQVRRRKQQHGVRRCDFTEGWVEFRDKRVAKRVAASLHNTPMGSRKRQRHYADLWCIKYLHRFHWSQLNERLVYEQTVLNQRLRTEVSQAKKESSFYLNNMESKGRRGRGKGRGKGPDGEQVEEKSWDFTQRLTEEEIQTKKRKKKEQDKARLLQEKSQSNVSLLAKIFNSSQST